MIEPAINSVVVFIAEMGSDLLDGLADEEVEEGVVSG
jgi:hypothetical protein